MSRENVERVRSFFEVKFRNNNIRELQDLYCESHISHLPTGDYYGPEGVRIDAAAILEGFPDLQISIEETFDAGDAVAYRFLATGTHDGCFLGFGPTGRPVKIVGLGIDRFDGEMVTERWIQFDSLGLMQQLGLCPSS